MAPRNDRLDINETILEVVVLTRSEALRNSVSLQVRLAKDLPLIQGDRVQLQQVMLNLIINAVEPMSGVSERSPVNADLPKLSVVPLPAVLHPFLHIYWLLGHRGTSEANVDDHWRSRRTPELQVVPVATWPAGDRSRPRPLRANPRRGWNGLALSPQVGCPRASLVDNSSRRQACQRPSCSSGSTSLT
jgi:hypothetical protein